MIPYFGQIIPGERASGAPSWEGGVLVFSGCCNRWSKTESLKTIHMHYFTLYMDFKFSVGLMWVTVKASTGLCSFSQLQGRISIADSSCLCGLLLPSAKAAVGVKPVFSVAVDCARFSLL